MTPRTPDEAALLAGVWAASHDDLPRLVYADWLEEHGDAERAEFIRVQCELAACRARWERPPAGLVERERELQTSHGDRWRAGLKRFGGLNFARGFPRPTLGGSPPGPDTPAGCPLVWADFNRVTPDGLRAFATGLAADRVERLRLEVDGGRGWTAAHADALAAARDRLANVTMLSFNGNWKPADAARWTAAVGLPRLRDLTPPGGVPGADLIAVLDTAPVAATLRWLGLDDVRFDAAAVATLADARGLGGLEHISFKSRTATDADLARLVTSPNLPNVRAWYLDDTRAGRLTAEALAADPASVRLRYLYLPTAAGSDVVLDSPHLTGLWLFSLPRITDARTRAKYEARFGPQR